MQKTGIATLARHYGKAPRWLFDRMAALSKEIIYALVSEFGQKAFLEKLSDPFWFQALGCVLGFDWHASRMSAKVDNTAVQDGYQLYHHVFVFTEQGEWSVVQQGMNEDKRTARRYHWLSENIKDFVVEPHAAICCDKTGVTLNMVATESMNARQICTSISKEKPEKTVKEMKKIQKLELTKRHCITANDINPTKLYRILTKTYESQSEDFERLLGINGVGPKTIRALSLISELIYGAPPSYRDPARFSFAHGGKDGTPYPVDRKTYDKTIDVMKNEIYSASIGNQARMEAVRRLAKNL